MDIFEEMRLKLPCRHVESLITKNKKLFKIIIKNMEYALVCKEDSNTLDHYIHLERCSNLIPDIYTFFISKNCLLIKYLGGITAADFVLQNLSIKNIEKIYRIAYDIGIATATFHDQISTCNHIFNKFYSSLDDVIEERCKLLRLLKNNNEKLIDKICNKIKKIKNLVGDLCSKSVGHGDLHLYQIILYHNNIFYIDPGPEPHTKTWPCIEYDIASLIRSFEYIEGMLNFVDNQAQSVAEVLSAIMLSGYSRKRNIPDARLLELLYLIRTVYEYFYESINNTGLQSIPLSVLQTYIESGETIIRRLIEIDD